MYKSFTFTSASAVAFTFLLIVTLFSFAFCSDNLVPNPGFLTPEGDQASPFFWYYGGTAIEGIRKSEFSVGPAGSPALRALGIKGGEDRSGEWRCTIEGLEKGKRYLLAFKVYRENMDDGVFPEIELAGNRIRLSNHLSYGAWQAMSVRFTAPDEAVMIKFINDYPVDFYFSSPVLVKLSDAEIKTADRSLLPRPVKYDGFPLIAYGAGVADLPLVRELGFTGLVAGLNEKNVDEMVDATVKAGLKIVANVRDDAAIRKVSTSIFDSSASSSSSSSLLGWYIADEPEGGSVPLEEIVEKVRKIRDAGSSHPTFMAMVRPAFVSYYKDAADVILMDQYPVPGNPIIWLSRSMEEAKSRAEGKEIWAVIQIFGGQGWKGKGWDRAPDYAEMRALSYLSIVHGAKGLFFYTVKDGNFDLKLDRTHLGDVKRLIQELRYLGPLYLSDTAGYPGFNPDSLYEFAPDGTRPVHARMLKDGERTVIIAVNVLDKEVKGRLTDLGDGLRYFDEYFSGKRYVVKDGNIADLFGPYEVKLYVGGKSFVKVRVLDGTGRARAGLYAEVAGMGLDRTLGLMFRELPSDDRAILFRNERPQVMKVHTLNVKKPFDLLFIDEEHRISEIFTDIPSCETESACRHYISGKPASGALEMKAGMFDKFGIKKGDRIEFH